VNYSYAIPNPAANVPVLKAAFANWEASGVTQFTSGEALTPSCGSTGLTGLAANDPSLTGIGLRCDLVAGQSLTSGFVADPNLAWEDQLHWNPAALVRPVADVANNIGSFGNSGPGILRNPGWANWDFTLARRIPVNIGRGGSVRIQI